MERKEPHIVDQLFWRIALEEDEEAFRILFFEFFSSLCVFAHRYVDSWEVCEDIVQEMFLKIWKNRKNITIHNSCRNFLITSVRNSCIDYLRKKETEKIWREQMAEKTPLVVSEDLYSRKELEEILHTALAKLPDNIRIVFEKNRFEGMSYREIAEEQHISVKTVEAYMSKALKLLRIELKDYLPLLILLLG